MAYGRQQLSRPMLIEAPIPKENQNSTYRCANKGLYQAKPKRPLSAKNNCSVYLVCSVYSVYSVWSVYLVYSVYPWNTVYPVHSIYSVHPVTGASTLLNAGPNNRPFQTVEPEKLTNKFYKNNFCALLGDGACI